MRTYLCYTSRCFCVRRRIRFGKMSHLLQLLLMFAIVVVAAKMSGWLSQRLGQPAVFGEILVGLVLGPSLLNFLGWPIFLPHGSAGHVLDPAASALTSPLMGTLKDLSEIGVVFLMFMAGLETDVAEMRRVGRVAFWAAVGGVIGPMVFGFFTSEGFAMLGMEINVYEAVFIGTILTATSVSISAQTLMELGKLKSKEGTTILGAAVIDDVIGIIVLSFVIAFKPATEGTASAADNLVDHVMAGLAATGLAEPAAGVLRIAILILFMALFFFGAIVLGRAYIGRILNWAAQSKISEGLLASAIVIGLLYAWSAEFIGSVAAITGGYLAGILVARTEYHQTVTQKLHSVTYSLLVPVFFISIGMQANVKPIFAPLAKLLSGGMDNSQVIVLWFTFAIIFIAVFTKVLGCMAGAKWSGFDWLSSYRVGVGMISRGEVGLIVATVGLTAGVINRDIFSIMVLMVLVTTLVTPIWLKSAFKGEANRHGADAAAEQGG